MYDLSVTLYAQRIEADMNEIVLTVEMLEDALNDANRTLQEQRKEIAELLERIEVLKDPPPY